MLMRSIAASAPKNRDASIAFDLLAGLIIAEVELESEEMEINIPSWAGMELTYLKGWSNAELVRMIGQE